MKRLEEISGALPPMDRLYRPNMNPDVAGDGMALASSLLNGFESTRISRIQQTPPFASRHIALTTLAETTLTTAFSKLADITPEDWLGNAHGLRLFAYCGGANQRFGHLRTMVYQQEYRNTWRTKNVLTVELNGHNGGLNVRGLQAGPLRGEANLVNVPEVYEAVAADIAQLKLALQHIS